MLVTEAVDVVSVLLSADDYCPECAKNLVDSFITKFPEFLELATMMYNDEFESSADKTCDELPGGRPDEPYA